MATTSNCSFGFKDDFRRLEWNINVCGTVERDAFEVLRNENYKEKCENVYRGDINLGKQD